VGWQIVMNAKIGFKLQVTVTMGLHSLYVWCLQMMWLFSRAPDNPEDDTVMVRNGADEVYSAMQRWMHPIWTEDKAAQQDVAQQMIQIVKP
jgi:hypothetical protein